MHLEEIKNEFSPQFQCSWNALEHELTIVPTPRFPTRGLIRVFKRQKTSALFNSVLFRKLVVAEARYSLDKSFTGNIISHLVAVVH